MTDIIEKIWNLIMDYGKLVRTNGLDGFDSWNNIKTILEKYNQPGEWLPEAINRYDEMMAKFDIIDIKKDKYIENINDEQKKEKSLEWEVTHFFFQHSRILKPNEEANLLKLMQIAYNAGQLKAVWNNKYNTDDRKKYYEKYHLNTYTSYMTYHIIEKMNKQLYSDPPIIINIKAITNNAENIKQQGGEFYKKYKKYKAKIIKNTNN
jgi:hypothetical protein